MFRSNLLAISAFGLCFATTPVMVGAQTVQLGDETDAVFVPLVEGCIAMPTVETCQSVRAVVAECAGDLDRERCSVLFVDAEPLFDDPSELEAVQAMLSDAAEAITILEFPDVQNGDIDDATRANSERTLLLGDENLMSHSAPPLLDSDTPPPDQATDESDPPEPVAK